jgi:signal transduction histidine kinase/HAMP domain-containing protein
MLSLRNLSIRHKLTLLLVGTATIVLLLASVIILVNNARNARAQMKREYEALAEVLGAKSAVALSVADIRPDSAQAEVADLKAAPTILAAALYDADGKEVARYPAESARDMRLPQQKDAGATFTGEYLDVIADVTLDQDGEKTPVGKILLRATTEQLDRQIWENVVNVAVIFLVAAGIAVVLSSLLQRTVSGPILSLAAATRRVSSERDYSIRVPKRAEDEIGVLIDGFNTMLSQIEVRDEELTQRGRQLEESIKQATARSALLAAINQVFQRAAGGLPSAEIGETFLAAAEELTGSRFGFVGELNAAGLFNTLALSNPGWDACTMSQEKARELIVNMPLRGVDRGTLRDKQSRIVNDPANHPDHVHTPEGHPEITCFLGVPLKHGDETIGMIGLGNKPGGYDAADQAAVEALSVAFVEALVRKRAEEALQRAHDELEDRVRQRTAALKSSNKELEQFAYIASHDLQEPLRMVSSYMQLFERKYKDQLDETANKYIDYAVDGAARMQRMVNDLLAYSRVMTRGKALETTDCEQAWSEALANLRKAVEETGAEVTHDPLPRVKADPAQLIQLFQNLIGNAVKYRREERPRVHVSAVREEDRWLFSVRDNGIGIEPQYAERIFVIFQRLHGKGEYSGTGIGLAVCKKIVDRHGGRIWVESKYGRGSTFYFTIPDRGGT